MKPKDRAARWAKKQAKKYYPLHRPESHEDREWINSAYLVHRALHEGAAEGAFNGWLRGYRAAIKDGVKKRKQ